MVSENNIYSRAEWCCKLPKFEISTDVGRMEMKMECLNCNEFYIVITGAPIIDYWNEHIIERDRKKRTIIKVDFIDYPYPFAMI